MFSRNLFVPDFVRRFFVSCAQISEAYAVRTLMKFGCSWRKIGHKSRCMKDSERTSPHNTFENYFNLSPLERQWYNPIFDSQIYQNTAESLILPGFFSGAFSFYYIVFFLNQIWMIDFYDFSRDCLLSFWISFIFLLVRNS